MNYDVIIIGGGPAGLSAGIYASRAKLKTLLIEKVFPGGQVATTYLVENYPGFDTEIGGMELSNHFKTQAEKFGTEIKTGEITKIEQDQKAFKVSLGNNTFTGATLIIATGTVPRKLNVPGEKEFLGKGVSYCATCDGAFFKGKKVAVSGCGNSGVGEGLFLLKFADHVTFIARSSYVRADKHFQEKAKANKNTLFLLNRDFVSINGTKTVESITIKDLTNNKEETIPMDGIFIYKGWTPNSSFVKDLVKCDKDGYIITNEDMETSVPGIYAAGDIRIKTVRQIATATSDGVIAAIKAEHYISNI